MLCAPLCNQVRWVACVLCSIALTGCPQLERDDFRIVTSRAIGGNAGSGSAAGNHDGGTSVNDGTGGNFGKDTSGGKSTSGGSTLDGTGDSSSPDGTGGSLSDGSGGSPPDGAGGSPSGTGGFESVGGAAGSSSTGVLCSTAAFGNVEIITGLSISGEIWSPSLSEDGLTLFFEGFENNYNHVYAAIREDRGRAFSPAKLVSINGAPSIQASPFLSADGKSLYFVTSKTQGSTDRDIWVASRTDVKSLTFSGAQALAGINSASPENAPWVSQDGATLLFTSARSNGAGDNDIWMAIWSASTAQFNTPTNLSAVNSRYRDGSAILSKDGLTLYFSSDRGSSGVGESDIWTATRDAITETDFETLSALSAVNSASKETDPVLSQDETELFFISDRSGDPQIWRATRSCAPAP